MSVKTSYHHSPIKKSPGSVIEGSKSMSAVTGSIAPPSISEDQASHGVASKRKRIVWHENTMKPKPKEVKEQPQVDYLKQ